MAAYQHLKGPSALSTPLPILKAMYPPPCRGEIQIYRWGHFTGQLRQETGNKKRRLFAASRTSVVRAFWKARLFLAVGLQSEDRNEGRAFAATGGLQIIPGFLLSLSTVRKDLEQQSAATLHRNTKLCTPVETPPPQATGVPSSWSDYVPEPSEPQAPHLGTELCPTSTNSLCPLFTPEAFSSAISFFFLFLEGGVGALVVI